MSRPSALIAVLLGGILAGHLLTAAAPVAATQEAPTRQAIIWTSGDPDVAHRMALMYTHACQKAGWVEQNRLVVWGPSARLLAGDKDLQAKVKQMQDDGVEVVACIACATSYGVVERLRELGLEVKPMGQPLAEMSQSPEWQVMTF